MVNNFGRLSPTGRRFGSKQNSRIIEESFRPYITAEIVHIGTSFYLRFKNYGQSAAIIDSIKLDDNAKKIQFENFKDVYDDFCENTIPPNYSFMTCIFQDNVSGKENKIAIDIKTIQEKKGHPEITCAKCGECVSVCPNKAISYEFRFKKNMTACGCGHSSKPKTAAGRVIQQLLHPANLFRFAAFTFETLVPLGMILKVLVTVSSSFLIVYTSTGTEKVTSSVFSS